MIEFLDVSKYYRTRKGKHHVLRNVSFILPSNTNIALLGRNGAGKSTLMRLIGGAEAPSEGNIYRSCSVSWPMGLAGGFQGSMTGVENIRFICRIYGLSKEDTNEVVAYVHEFSEIGEYMNMPIKTLSSGMRARVVFGLSLSMKFDLYLVDELTSVGDFQFREKAATAFKELKKRASIVFASHNLKSVAENCDSAIVLYNGEFQFFQNVHEGIENYKFWVNTKAESPLQRKKFDIGKSVTKKAAGKKKAAAKKTAKKKVAAKKASSTTTPEETAATAKHKYE